MATLTAAKTFRPSPYQQAIFDALAENVADIQVNATAGSGKSTTLLEALHRVPYDVRTNTLLCAFNREIANHLEKKVPEGVTVKTIHGLGYGALCFYFQKQTGARFTPKVDERKYRKLIESYWVGTYRSDTEPAGDDEDEMFRLLHFVRVTLTNPTDREAFLAMADERELELSRPERMLNALPAILAAGQDVTCQQRHRGFAYPMDVNAIDFDDMIHLPFVLDAYPKKFRLVMVDEAQDLSAAQLDLVLKCRADGGRLVMVGDPRQCQPEGTMVSVVRSEGNRWSHRDITQVPIERVMEGDRVVSYSPGDTSFIQKGRVVEGTASRNFEGELVVAETSEGLRSRYTPNHRCFANFSPLRDKWAVYMMGNDRGQFRVGKSKLGYETANGSGPRCRMKAEKAEAMWVLDVYETDVEARTMEAAIAGKFGIPQLCFEPCGGENSTLIPLKAAWGFIGDNYSRGVECLEYFGRDVRYPLARTEPDGSYSYFTLKRPRVVRACNLISGCLMLPYGKEGHVHKSDWQPVYLHREKYSGPVYSLEVEKEQLYIADGLVTHNSIYAFAGADANSWKEIRRRTGARQLPLSICYRCPKAVIELAQTLAPEIEAAPGAPQGVVEDVKAETFRQLVTNRDMVLCRINSPLISTAFRLIGEGKPAKVRGRDIGAQLVKIIDQVEKMEGFDFQYFFAFSERYRDNQARVLAQHKDNESKLASLHDRVDSIQAVYINVSTEGGRAVGDLRAKVDSLFSDTQNGCILLSSIHKAKGLEADRVWLLRPDLLPHPMAKSEAAREQEANLKFVAISRAMRELYIVAPDPEER